MYLEGDALVLEDVRERDPDVLAFVTGADDLEGAIHRCMAMGARVLLTAGATLDSEPVEHRFSEMTSELDRRVLDVAERVDQSAKTLLDTEQSRLTLALHTWLEEVIQVLGTTFDENSKKSAIARLEVPSRPRGLSCASGEAGGTAQWPSSSGPPACPPFPEFHDGLC